MCLFFGTPSRCSKDHLKTILRRIVEKISNRNPYMDGVINTRHEPSALPRSI